MNAPTLPTGEIARLGKEIYERDIRERSKMPTTERSSSLTWIPAIGRLGTMLLTQRNACGEAPQRGQRLERAGGISRAAALRCAASAEKPVIEGVVNAANEPVIPSPCRDHRGGRGVLRPSSIPASTGFSPCRPHWCRSWEFPSSASAGRLSPTAVR